MAQGGGSTQGLDALGMQARQLAAGKEGGGVTGIGPHHPPTLRERSDQATTARNGIKHQSTFPASPNCERT